MNQTTKTLLIIFSVLAAGIIMYFVFKQKKPSTVAETAKVSEGDRLMNYIESTLNPEQLQRFREWVIIFEREPQTDPERAKKWLTSWEADSAALKIPLEAATYRNIMWLMHDTDGIITKAEWDQLNTDIVFLYR